jgi:hypothetical protein
MPIVIAISEFMEKSRNLCNRLRSPEAVNVSTADLNLLREQLKVLDSQVSHVLEQKNNGQVIKTKSLTPPPSTRFS